MIKFPYGIADFQRIRRDRMVYVDRTAHIRDVENLGDVLVFLRPRRFGKSLWLRTLATYYDLRHAGKFDEIFGGLAIHSDPTPLAHRFFVLVWNFSRVTSLGGVDEITESLHEHVLSRVKTFVSDYRDHLDDPVETEHGPETALDSLLSAVRRTPYKLYLLIDEYDNFVNEVMARDVETYRALFDAGGPFKELMKSVKEATEGLGLEKVFVTGVAPVALNDLTSGFNNAKNVSSKAKLATLCGFLEEEVRDLLGILAREHDLSADTVEAAVDTMRTWYNGYRFSGESGQLVYNPINALYFLENLYENAKPPRELQDQNLRADRGKLAFIARTAVGAGVVEELTEGGEGTIRISRLLTSFSVKDLTTRITKDPNVVASFLYYMGILTLADVPLRLRIPNLVVKKLLLDRLLEIFLPDEGESAQARRLALSVFQDGELEPLLTFFEEKLLPVLSNRDRGAAPKISGRSGSGVNEMVVKSLFLSILFDDHYYKVSSEPELERAYADLCLLVRDEMRHYGFYDLLFEFKLVRRKDLKLEGREIREADEAALRKLPRVRQAFTEARAQIGRYRTALARSEGEALNLRSWVVVAVGLERMLAEEVG